jgi:arginyl-tRNA--protein-N-Asp/Glu arginylyltransferase
MTTQTARLPRFFYRMPPRPCPYLQGRTEQNIFTELSGPAVSQLYDALTQAGFRRSHNVAYRPSCPGCQACVPVRVVAWLFEPTRSLVRVARANADVGEDEVPGLATPEQYALFARYLSARHADGEMAGMTYADYVAMVEDSPLNTLIAEYRDGAGKLIGACLVDRLHDGLSAVYSFFEPSQSERSLGTYMIQRLIERTRAAGLPYLYLGYWIAGSRKMAYKANFRPLEGLTSRGWTVLP